MNERKSFALAFAVIIAAIFAVLLVAEFFITGWQKDYKAGNLKGLDYSVETDMSMDFIRQHIDYVIQPAYSPDSVPASLQSVVNEWNDLPENFHCRKIYFRENPEEVYLVKLDFAVSILNVYNGTIRSAGWVTDPLLVSPKEKERIINRFREEILNKVAEAGSLEERSRRQ